MRKRPATEDVLGARLAQIETTSPEDRARQVNRGTFLDLERTIILSSQMIANAILKWRY